MEHEIFKGSCLCGQVHYEVTGNPEHFYHCHCRRCQKATGTGHASNIMVKTENFTWLSGEDLLTSYKVPEAERFFTNFCSHCGSPMPRVVPELGITVIAAGSLDSKPAIKPSSRIFWDSRSEWSCNGDGIEIHAEYPT